MRKSPVEENVDFDILAKATDGFSGADVTEICQVFFWFSRKDFWKNAKTLSKMRKESILFLMFFFLKQRAVKYAIRESIQRHQVTLTRKKREEEEKEKEKEGEMEVDGEEKTTTGEEEEEEIDITTMVPKMTRKHFEMAMDGARKSVSPQDLHKYRMFAENLQQASGQFGEFRFPDEQQGSGDGY